MNDDIFFAGFDVDPRDVQANKRYKGSHVLPPVVREAMRAITDGTYAWMVEEHPDYVPPKLAHVELIFTFPDNRSDVDGPVKRTVDAFAAGVKRAHPKWHDGKIRKLCVEKEVDRDANPRVFIYMRSFHS